MTTTARKILATATLGVVTLLAACSAPRSARAVRTPPTCSFTVLESSSDRSMTPKEQEQLRDAVAKFLEGEGLKQAGVYYVRVDFASETADAKAEWALVRLINQPAATYQLIAAYPDIGDYYYPVGYRYSAYPYSSYYDPFDHTYGAYARPLPVYSYPPLRQPKPDKKDHHPPGTTGTNEHKPAGNYNHPRHNPNDQPGVHDGPDRRPRPDSSNYSTRRSGTGSESVNAPADGGGRHHPTPSDNVPQHFRDRSGGASPSPAPQPSYSPPSTSSHSSPSRGIPAYKTGTVDTNQPKEN